MKKEIKISICVIFFAIFIVASCNKEELYNTNNVNTCNKYDENVHYIFYEYGTIKELEAYIDKFSTEAGVDIFGLSESEYLELLSIDADAVVNCFEDKLANSSNPEGILTSLSELVDKINHYAEQENYTAVLDNYNAMIDMVYCNAEPDRPGSAVEQFNIQVENMQENVRKIELDFPGLKKLDSEVEQECYALAFYYKEKKKSIEKGLYQGRCLNMYNDAKWSATYAFLGQSIICGCLGPIAGAVCMAQNTVTFCFAIRAAEVAFKNCVD